MGKAGDNAEIPDSPNGSRTRRRTGQHRPLGSGSDSLNDFAQGGVDSAELEDLGRGIHQG